MSVNLMKGYDMGLNYIIQGYDMGLNYIIQVIK